MNMNPEPRKALLILGMHRSGTSAVTRVMNLLGAELGEPLIPAGTDNPDGFWEHAEAVKINEDLLTGLGRTWYDMREMPKGWKKSSAVEEARARIREFIANNFMQSRLCAVKDPRMCLTAPIWVDSFIRAGFDVQSLLVVRDPREVVESLHKRNGWDREPLFLMWVQYMVAAEAASRRHPRAMITFDQILGDWRSALDRVSRELEIQWPVGLDQASPKIDAFLHRDKRHHAVAPLGSGVSEAEQAMPRLPFLLYKACLAVAEGRNKWKGISSLRGQFEDAAALYAQHIDKLLRERWDAEGRALTAEARAAEAGSLGEDAENSLRSAILETRNAFDDRLGGVEELMRKGGWDLQKVNENLVSWRADQANAISAVREELLARERNFEQRLDAIASRFELHQKRQDSVMSALREEMSQRDRLLDERLHTFGEESASRAKQWQQTAMSRMEEEFSRRDNLLRARLENFESHFEDSAKQWNDSALAAVRHALSAGLASQQLESIASRIENIAGQQQEAVSRVEARLQRQKTSFGAALLTLGKSVEEKFSDLKIGVDAISTALPDAAALQHGLSERDAHIRALTASVEELTHSTSWRLTAPLRWLRARLFRRDKAVSLDPQNPNAPSGAAFPETESDEAAGNREPATNGAHQQHGTQHPRPEGDGAHDVLEEMLSQATGTRNLEYVPLDDRPADLSNIDVRAIAFYLPQFHPIPENDVWWGRGFTEWTNVSKAVPQYVGHYQPRLPGELGFYDLRLPEVMRRQVELARHYGLKGFCFHYYWFGGRRLLERPLQQFLDNPDIDFPFCVCWANENWTRRWDGFDQEILLGQNHSPEDDIAFISSLEPLLRDPRYIRVDGKPLVALYRPSILPDAAATLERWRAHCRRVGIGELFLAMAQFDVEDPRVYGFDAAIEFPPHKLARGLQPINRKLQIINPKYSGNIIEYGEIIERARQQEVPPYDLIRGIFPSWDNEARKPGAGYTFANATPERYREWLDETVEYARANPVAGEKLVFINAWNEWAEGAYLEPDRRYGYAYLDQTRQALLQPPKMRRIVIVSHDAHPHGAQYLALHMARMYREAFGLEVDLVLLDGGRLRDEFARWATVHDLTGLDPMGEEAAHLAHHLFMAGARHAIANTTVSGLFAKILKNAGFDVIGLVHEMPGVIASFGLYDHARAVAEHCDRVVFPSERVREGFRACVQADDLPNSVIHPQGLYKLNRYAFPGEREGARRALRNRLGIPESAKVVLCVGYADHRKGIDLFVEIGINLMRARSDVHFLWVGHFDTSLEEGIRENIRSAGQEDHFHFPGIDPDTDLYYAGADVYALTSREDPFPSVVMEALQVEVPVMGFAGAGGFVELLERGTGVVVPAFDTKIFSEALSALLDDDARARAMGARGRELVEEEYDFRKYLFELTALLGCPFPKVSVVVPNYNYARHLKGRIDSILAQTLPFYELIILDDSSNDGSMDVIRQLAIENRLQVRIVQNQVNSGSVSRQWSKGTELARGDLVWIAEADDLCEPEFLEELTGAMVNPAVVLAYCQSKQIDGSGRVLSETYLEYTDDVAEGRWLRPYRETGLTEIHTCLAIKNTIPNVSAVLFRREALLAAVRRELDTMTSFKIAGDWVAYLAVLEQGDIAFVHESLNLHRRHASSVTLGGDPRPHMLEVLRVQQMVARRYRLDGEVQKKVAAYVEHLRQYFGLNEAELENLRLQLMALEKQPNLKATC